MKFRIVFFFVLYLAGAGLLGAQEARTIEFRIEGMSCQACARTATRALEQIEGLQVKAIDPKSGKTVVEAPAAVSTDQIKHALAEQTNFEAFFEGETLPRSLTEAERAGLDIEDLPAGQKVRFKSHLAAGKYTIFYFHAAWCGPCRLYGPRVEQLVAAHPDQLALRKVDVGDWNTPVARQLTREYRMPGLPFTLVFDDRGKLLGQVVGNDVDKLRELLSLPTD